MKTRRGLYWIVVVLLQIASISLCIWNIIHWHPSENAVALFVFSLSSWIVAGLTLLFQLQPLFNWFYAKASKAFIHAQPELFAKSIYLKPKNRAYRSLQRWSIILLVLAILLGVTASYL